MWVRVALEEARICARAPRNGVQQPLEGRIPQLSGEPFLYFLDSHLLRTTTALSGSKASDKKEPVWPSRAKLCLVLTVLTSLA